MVVNGAIISQHHRLFFLVYLRDQFWDPAFLDINDLSRIAFSGSPRLHMFADDVLLYQVIDSPEDFVSVQENITVFVYIATLNGNNFMMISREKFLSNPHLLYIWEVNYLSLLAPTST